MNEVERARQIVADLAAKITAAETRKVVVERDRDELAFDALALGDEKAKSRLTKLNREIIEIDAELAGLAAATRTAEERVLEARGVERIEIERQKAKRAVKRGHELRALAKSLDKSARTFFEDFAQLWSLAIELHALGAMPSVFLVESASRRALATISRGSRLQLEPLVPPKDQRSFADLADGWSVSISAYAEKRLGAPPSS